MKISARIPVRMLPLNALNIHQQALLIKVVAHRSGAFVGPEHHTDIHRMMHTGLVRRIPGKWGFWCATKAGHEYSENLRVFNALKED